MTYLELCDKYRNYTGVRFIQAIWGDMVPLHPGVTLDLWVPTTGSFTVIEKHNEIHITWHKG